MKANQPGSFVTAEQLARVQAEAKRAAAPEAQSEPPAQEAAAQQAEQNAPKQDDPVETFKRVKAENEKAIGTTITEEDINDYIFRGRILKKDIQAIKNKVTVTFQSLTPKELESVDQFVAKVKDTGKYTNEGIANLRTIEQLSYAWLEINGRALPKEIEKKKEAINQMGTHIINRVVDSFRCFDVLIELTLREDEFLKK